MSYNQCKSRKCRCDSDSDDDCRPSRRCHRRRNRCNPCLPPCPPVCPPCPSPPCKLIDQKFRVTNLVSNIPGRTPNIDPAEINSWGIIIDGTALVVANNDGSPNNITQYSFTGVPGTSITVTGLNPTGVVKNTTSAFLVGGVPAIYITATENGTIDAWATGAATTVEYTGPAGTSYKGIAIAGNFLYATDFNGNKVDTFNNAWVLQANTFIDPAPVTGFAPFNIAIINGLAYVSYAMQDPLNIPDDLSGPGNGYINIFSINASTGAGTFVKRFVNPGGYLNSPWGMILAPTICSVPAGSILVGNFGDGSISVYNSNGIFLGKLRDCNCVDIFIDGLWGLASLPGPTPTIFFASGPNHEANGLVGNLTVC